MSNIKDELDIKKELQDRYNLIQFDKLQNNTILTENEINNLFLGFVKLIKKNVIIERENKYKKQIQALCDEIMELQNKIVQLESLMVK